MYSSLNYIRHVIYNINRSSHMLFDLLFLDEIIIIKNLKNVLLKTLFKITTIEHLCYSKSLNCSKLFEIMLVYCY